MNLCKKILLCALFACVPFLMAQVSGPTTVTPRLTVGSGTITSSGLRVNGDATITGNVTAANVTATADVNAVNVIVSGTCTGCGGQQTTNSVALQFTEGCSNSPDINISWTVTGNVIVVTFRDGADADCTSDATNFGTTANALPLVPFGDITEIRRVKYTALSIAGTQTDACAVFQTNRSVEFLTGVACSTAPGNVAKVVTDAAQNYLTFILAN